MFLFIGQKNFLKKIRLRVGVWRWVCGGGRGSLDGKTGVQGGRFSRATLRDVRLFRCKRFTGCLFSEVKDRTFTKKGVLFRLRSYCFGSLYREGIKNKGNIIQ